MAVATALAAGSIVIAATSATASFVQAGKQRKKQTEAEEAAAKAMESAKQELSVNYYEGLSIQTEGYELERARICRSDRTSSTSSTSWTGWTESCYGKRTFRFR